MTFNASFRPLAAGCFVVLLIVGCESGPKGKVTPVAGRVTLDGKPLAGITVSYMPETSPGQIPGSFGMTNADGNYVLKTADGRDGAVVGKHDVTVRGERADDRSGTPATGTNIPVSYTQPGANNPLGKIEVVAGKATYDLELKTK